MLSLFVRRVDEALALPMVRTDSGRRAWVAVTALGSRPVVYAAVVVRCLRRTEAGPLWQPLAVLTAGDVAREFVCRVIARPRPTAGALTYTQGPSFPSRHTTMALLAVRLVSDRRSHSRDSLAAAVGVSRMVLGAHWPTDVIGGWLFATCWLALTRTVLPIRRQNAGNCRPTTRKAWQRK
ncbi:phosphatase PAP2 family protein [Streptomyces halstedii]|uniref:phosphatase PAP2 family protein n=1 Tax=Streptomyces halstedii TaxID=1944 RepID=UPI0036BAEFE5